MSSYNHGLEIHQILEDVKPSVLFLSLYKKYLLLENNSFEAGRFHFSISWETIYT